MSLWNNNPMEQAGLTATLLNPDGLRPRILAVPMLAAMVPTLDHVHAQLASVAPARTTDAAERELAALTEEGNALDIDGHDRPARAMHRVLDGLAEMAATPEEADGYRTLSLRILPLGLATTQLTWMAEAGNVSRLQQELDSDADFCDALDAVVLPGKRTMLTLTRSFVAAGLRLGAIEQRRAELRQDIAAGVTAGAAEPEKEPVGIGVARKEWVDSVEVLRGIVSMPQSPVPADVRKAILALFDEAEKKGDARARARAAARKPEDPVVAKPSKAPPAPANGASKSVPPAARPS